MNVIITGASRGIGYALAKKFSYEERIKLYIISRTEEKLNKLKKECQAINPEAEIIVIAGDIEQISDGRFSNLLGRYSDQ
jgi:short-subunit dehydrogenase